MPDERRFFILEYDKILYTDGGIKWQKLSKKKIITAENII